MFYFTYLSKNIVLINLIKSINYLKVLKFKQKIIKDTTFGLKADRPSKVVISGKSILGICVPCCVPQGLFLASI